MTEVVQTAGMTEVVQTAGMTEVVLPAGITEPKFFYEIIKDTLNDE